MTTSLKITLISKPLVSVHMCTYFFAHVCQNACILLKLIGNSNLE